MLPLLTPLTMRSEADLPRPPAGRGITHPHGTLPLPPQVGIWEAKGGTVKDPSTASHTQSLPGPSPTELMLRGLGGRGKGQGQGVRTHPGTEARSPPRPERVRNSNHSICGGKARTPGGDGEAGPGRGPHLVGAPLTPLRPL